MSEAMKGKDAIAWAVNIKVNGSVKGSDKYSLFDVTHSYAKARFWHDGLMEQGFDVELFPLFDLR